jgi:hypothetical protein
MHGSTGRTLLKREENIDKNDYYYYYAKLIL